MRKRECFENTVDYVRYLERRGELMELRLKKCLMDRDLFDSHRSVNERSNAFEMSTLRKARSGLPVNLYLDQRASRKPTVFRPWLRRANFSCMKNSSLLSIHLCG